MPLRYLQGPVSELADNDYHILDIGPFILCSDEWPVITVFCILHPHAGALL